MPSIRLPQSDQPRVSIVVLVTDAGLAARVLGGIAEVHDPAIETEVVVVVNTADPATRSLVSDGARGARTIVRNVNTGTAVGWNLGFDAARGSFVALLHEDSVPEPGWLEPLLSSLAEEPRAAVAASRLLHPDGTAQGGGIVAWRDGEVTWVTAGSAPKAMSSSAPYPIGHGSTAAMLVERASWAAVGGFDERYFPAFRVEVDFGLALRARGRTALSAPRSRVRHDLRSSTPGGPDPYRTMSFRRYLQERNRKLFLEKWSDALPLLPVPPEPQARNSPEAMEPVLEQLGAEALAPVRRQLNVPRATRTFTARGEAGLDRRLEAAHAEVRDGFLAWAVAGLERTTAELRRERRV